MTDMNVQSHLCHVVFCLHAVMYHLVLGTQYLIHCETDDITLISRLYVQKVFQY